MITSHPIRPHSFLLKPVVVAAALACVLVLAGCSSSDTSEAAAPAKPSASASGTPSETPLSREDYTAAYDTCMTSQGAGPQHGTDSQGNQTTTVTTAGSASEAANAYCSKKLGVGPAMTFVQSPEAKAKALTEAKCLRENGLDAPDPTDGISQIPAGASPAVLAKCGINTDNSTVIVNGK